MVFFTCNSCGNALKKNKVEKHYAIECRSPPSVSCMDCHKDFYGKEYESHNKCISEEQKYSGQPSNGQLQVGKGEKKQMEWVETVRKIIETKGPSLTPQERQLLENLKDFENIPRKKKKFENFLKNAMGRYVDPRTIEKVWLLLEEHKSQPNNKEMQEAKENLPDSREENEDDEKEAKGIDQALEEETSKLSKKAKKEKKKKEKYQQELESISKEKQEVDNDGNLGEEEVELGTEKDDEKGIKSKKNKKKKRDKKAEEENEGGNSDALVVANGTKDSKKKKRKHSENAEDVIGDKKRVKERDGQEEKEMNGKEATESGVNGVTDEDIKEKGKFKWNKTIVAILKSVPENELLVKRLRKKVLAEYQEALGEGKCQKLSLEEAMGMFDRKLHKIPGVKVHKDNAKLVKSS